MSVHIKVVLVVQTRGRLDDAEALVTGIEGHVGSASEFSTCKKKSKKKKIKLCCSVALLNIQMRVVKMLDEHLGVSPKEKKHLS